MVITCLIGGFELGIKGIVIHPQLREVSVGGGLLHILIVRGGWSFNVNFVELDTNELLGFVTSMRGGGRMYILTPACTAK